MQGWTRLGAHAHSSTSIFKTATVFFSGKYGFSTSVLATCLRCIVVNIDLVNFLSQWQQLKQLTMLAYNTQQITKFPCHSARQVFCLTLTICYTSLTLQFMATVASDFCAVVAPCVLVSIMSSERLRWNSVQTYVQLSCVYLLSTVDILHVIKCITRAWEWG